MDRSAYHTLVQEDLCISDHLSVLKFSVDEMEFTSAILLQSSADLPLRLQKEDVSMTQSIIILIICYVALSLATVSRWQHHSVCNVSLSASHPTGCPVWVSGPKSGIIVG